MQNLSFPCKCRSVVVSRERGRSVEYQVRDLPALHSGAVCAFRGTLELERDTPDGHFAHPLLAEVTQLDPVQDCRSCVERLRFYLDRVLEVDVECVARTVREELGVVFRQDPAQPLQFDLDAVVCRSV